MGENACERVLFVQEFVPEYRRHFFELLRAKCESAEIDLQVVCTYRDEMKAKRLLHSHVGLARYKPQLELRVTARTSLTYQPVLMAANNADLVIVEQANRHLTTWLLLLMSKVRTSPRIALWGHGEDRQLDNKRGLRASLKRASLRLPFWWFAYTAEVADYVSQQGFPDDRITNTKNSIDVDSLMASLAKAPAGRHPVMRVAYIGGLYKRKRIEFLLNAAELIAERDPQFRLTIAGSGELQSLVESRAAQESWLEYVGPVSGEAKGRLLNESSLILMPGLVGLVAVDSLVSGTPVVTIASTSHSPEFAYLTEHNSLVLPEGASANQYADQVFLLLNDRERLENLSTRARGDASQFGVEAMASAFYGGIISALQVARDLGNG